MQLVRFGCTLISAFIVAISIRILVFLLWDLRCGEYWDARCEHDYIWLTKLTVYLQISAACLWITTWVYLEIINYRQSPPKRSRFLIHLRYGPIAVVVLSIFTLMGYDLVMIQYSRWHIARYVHSSASPWEPANLELHNNYRSFCANGFSAHEYDLYGATAAAYFDDPDPAVRARALQANIYVYDWLNNPGNGPSVEVIRKAIADSDPLVREIAAEHRTQGWMNP